MTWENRIVGHDIVNPKTLKANEKNWRIHSDNQRAAINSVLDQVGWVTSVIVNKTTGNIVDGHLRVEEAIKTKSEIPVVYVDLTEDEEKLILATIDPLAAMAETNSEMLEELIDGLQINDCLLKSLDIGFDINKENGDNVFDESVDENESHALIVETKTEAEQLKIYNELTDRGFECKPIS